MNQGKHTAGKVVLIVLIVLVSLFDLFWMIGTIGIFMEGENASVSYNDMPVAELTDAPYLEELGQMYEGNATAGYTYYRLHLPVFSAGNKALEPEYDLYLDVEGEDYDDVERYYSYDDGSESTFERESAPLVPVGQTGEMTEILMIADDADRITVTFYSTADDYYDSVNGRQMEIHKPR